jgi:phosphoribosylamine--glycine ligase
MHTGREVKILENNSRPGDPEIINILPLLRDDFVDVCFRILDRNLTCIDLENSATVVTYKAPPNYGGYANVFPDFVDKSELNAPICLTEAYELSKKYGDDVRVYPGAMEQRDGEAYALKSRAVCVVGIHDSIGAARELSLEGLKAIKGGSLWYRNDVASRQHIQQSIRHMEELRHQL